MGIVKFEITFAEDSGRNVGADERFALGAVVVGGFARPHAVGDEASTAASENSTINYELSLKYLFIIFVYICKTNNCLNLCNEYLIKYLELIFPYIATSVLRGYYF